jgi:hypothetical protein
VSGVGQGRPTQPPGEAIEGTASSENWSDAPQTCRRCRPDARWARIEVPASNQGNYDDLVVESSGIADLFDISEVSRYHCGRQLPFLM